MLGASSMRKVIVSIQNFLLAEDGPTAVEYAVMLALIVVACLTSVGVLSTRTGQTFTDCSTKINAAITGS